MDDTIEIQIRSKAREWVTEFDQEFLVELIETYLTDAPKRLEELKAALSGGDEDSFTRAAHTLKSSTAQLGCVSFSELAKTIELGSRAGHMATLGGEVEQLVKDFCHLKSVLETVKNLSAEELMISGEPTS